MKTRAAVEDLKYGWLNDPIWDIEETEGFEEYRGELLDYRLEQQKRWRGERVARIKGKARSLGLDPEQFYELAEHIMFLESRIKTLEEAK